MSTLSRILFVCVHPRSPDTVACSAILLTFQVSFGAMYLHMSVDSQPILIQHRILYYIFVCIPQVTPCDPQFWCQTVIFAA